MAEWPRRRLLGCRSLTGADVNSTTTTPKKENPTEVWQPAAGLSVNSGRIIAPSAKAVAQREAALAEVDDQLGARKRLASLQARAALAGLELTESSTGFTLVGHGVRRHWVDLTSVARALGESEGDQ